MNRSAARSITLLLAVMSLAAIRPAAGLALPADPGSAGFASEPFDPEGKVTISLKEAKISDLVATLGVLANLPVYVDPDVQGTITIELHDVPIKKVLEMVSKRSGVSIRVENGKLVASRSAESLFAAATLPDSFQGAPRIAVPEYDKAKSEPQPVYATFVTPGWTGCYHYDVRYQEPPTFTGRLGAGTDAPAFFLTQFAYEPVSRVRYFVLEYEGGAAALALESRQPAAYRDADFLGGLRVVLSEKPQEGCQDAVSVRGGGAAPIPLSPRFEVSAPRNDGTSEIVMAPNVSLLAGAGFGVSSELSEEKTGQHRRMVISGYVTRDGKSVAALLTATAIWIDPADGREYYFAQSEKPAGSARLLPLTGEGAVVGRLSAGVATPRPLELKVFSGNAAPEKN